MNAARDSNQHAVGSPGHGSAFAGNHSHPICFQGSLSIIFALLPFLDAASSGFGKKTGYFLLGKSIKRQM
jgi:hypothetical protein